MKKNIGSLTETYKDTPHVQGTPLFSEKAKVRVSRAGQETVASFVDRMIANLGKPLSKVERENLVGAKAKLETYLEYNLAIPDELADEVKRMEVLEDGESTSKDSRVVELIEQRRALRHAILRIAVILVQDEVDSSRGAASPAVEAPTAVGDGKLSAKSILDELAFVQDIPDNPNRQTRRNALFDRTHNLISFVHDRADELRRKSRETFEAGSFSELGKFEEEAAALDSAVNQLEKWWSGEVFRRYENPLRNFQELVELFAYDPDKDVFKTDLTAVSDTDLLRHINELQTLFTSQTGNQELVALLELSEAYSLRVLITRARGLSDRLTEEFMRRLRVNAPEDLQVILHYVETGEYPVRNARGQIVREQLILSEENEQLLNSLIDQVNDENWPHRELFPLHILQDVIAQLTRRRDKLVEDRESMRRISTGAENVVIDPDRIWMSFFEGIGMFQPGEVERVDIKDPELLARLERGLLSFLLNGATRKMWENPGDKDFSGFTEFMSWEFSTKGTGVKMKLTNILDACPEGKVEDRIRRRITLITRLLKSNISWEEIISQKYATTELIEKHLETHLFTGDDLEVIRSLPIIDIPKSREFEPASRLIPEDDKQFGDLVFEASYIYAQWNHRYVYLSPETRGAYEAEVSTRIDRGEQVKAGKKSKVDYEADGEKVIIIPSDSEMKKAVGTARKGTVPQFDATITKWIEPEALVKIYVLDSDPTYKERRVKKKDAKPQYNYERFKLLLIKEITKKMVTKAELARQKKYGLFPQAEIKAGSESLPWEFKRGEIAISVGAYRANLGEYIPDIGVEHGGRLKVHEKQFESVLQRLRDNNMVFDGDEIEAADARGYRYIQLSEYGSELLLKLGKTAEMMGASVYKSSGAQMMDDGVIAKSPVYAVRLFLTNLYRENYAEWAGREGVFLDSIRIFQQLLPNPLLFMALERQGLMRLWGDREARMTADYGQLKGESETKRKYLQIYEWAKQIYAALAQGFTDVDLLNVSEVERPQGYFSTQQFLTFIDAKLQKLIEFEEKQIKYFTDALIVSEAEFASGLYDDEFYHPIVANGATYYTPLVGKIIETADGQRIMTPAMLDLHPDDVDNISETAGKAVSGKAIGLSRAFVKVFMSSMIVESLMRSGKNFVSIETVQALKWVLAGVRPSLYASANQEILGYRSYYQTFNFTEAEVDYMVQTANLNLEAGASVFLKNLSGLN